MTYNSSGHCFQCRNLSTDLKETISNISTLIGSLDMKILGNVEVLRMSFVRMQFLFNKVR